MDAVRCAFCGEQPATVGAAASPWGEPVCQGCFEQGMRDDHWSGCHDEFEQGCPACDAEREEGTAP